TFWPDASIFTQTTVYNKDILAARLRELSFLNKGISITLTDQRELDDDGNMYSETFLSEGGIVEFIQLLDKNAKREVLIPEPIYMEGVDKEANVAVEVALEYNSSYSENLFSYVNNINTIEGGTHVAGFRRAITRVFKAYGDR